jgi:hypothetical protein
MRRGTGRVAAATAIAVVAALGLVGCDTTYAFDSIEIGGDQAGRAPAAVSNTQFVRTVYADLLGRAPDVYDFEVESAAGGYTLPIDEQESLVYALDSLGDPDPLRAVIVAGLVRSAEVELTEKAQVTDPRAFIREQFRRFLGREPGSYELIAFEAEWEADPAVGPRTVVRALIGSREYQSR